jgi:hypothetical protein
MSAGSPFTFDLGSRDPDVASGGNIHFSRFYTTAKNYTGAIAIITLQSNGNTGTAALNFKNICPDTSSTSCSAVVDGSNTQLLGSINNGSIQINEPATTGGGTTSTSKGSKVKKATTPVAAATTAPAVAETTTKATSDETDTNVTHKVILKITDQDGKPIINAKVTLNGLHATSDANGKVTFNSVSEGTGKGNVEYKNQIIPISVAVTSSDATQSKELIINIKKSSSTAPVAIGLGVVVAILAILGILNKPKLAKLKPKTKPVIAPVIVPPAHAEAAIVTHEAPPAPTPSPAFERSEPHAFTPAAEHEPKTPEPAPMPHASEAVSHHQEQPETPKSEQMHQDETNSEPKTEESPEHEEAVAPGTIYSPENHFRAN